MYMSLIVKQEWRVLQVGVHVILHAYLALLFIYCRYKCIASKVVTSQIRGCIQKFSDWPPGA
jgi:hypothetical protein